MDSLNQSIETAALETLKSLASAAHQRCQSGHSGQHQGQTGQNLPQDLEFLQRFGGNFGRKTSNSRRSQYEIMKVFTKAARNILAPVFAKIGFSISCFYHLHSIFTASPGSSIAPGSISRPVFGLSLCGKRTLKGPLLERLDPLDDRKRWWFMWFTLQYINSSTLAVIGVGRLVSMKNWWCSGSMLIYQGVCLP